MTGTFLDMAYYRLERASETLGEAREVITHNRWNLAVNRLYYACFYAANGLLLLHQMTSAKHHGIRILFNTHFVKTNKIPAEIADVYNKLFLMRQSGDYDDFLKYTAEEVLPLVPKVENFIESVQRCAESSKK